MSNVVNLFEARAQRDAQFAESDESFDLMISDLDDLLFDMEADLVKQQREEQEHDRESFKILKANGYTDIQAQRVVRNERERKQKFMDDVNRKTMQAMHEKYPDDPDYFPENRDI